MHGNRSKSLRRAQELGVVVTRRGLLLAAATTGAGVFPVFAQEATKVAYVVPDGSGDGSSWDQAAHIRQINDLIDRVGPGGRVVLSADHGPYKGLEHISLSVGGRPDAPVTIAGADAAGRVKRAEFIGLRQAWTVPTDAGGAVDASRFGGSTLFRISDNASHLRFADISVRQYARILDLGGQHSHGIVIEDVDFQNVRDGIFTDSHSEVTDVLIRRVRGDGFSKKAVRVRGNCSRWRIEDCEFDSRWQYGDDHATGIEAWDTAHDIHVIGGFTRNCTELLSNDVFWNADGITSERYNYNILIENHTSSGNTDGGYDLKSERTLLRNCIAFDNNRNYRIWGGIKHGPIRLENCSSLYPHRRGGRGSTHHIWLAGYYLPEEPWGGAKVICSGGQLVGGSGEYSAVFVNGQQAEIRLIGTDISQVPNRDKLFMSVRDPEQTSRLVIE
jgi:hypothetical protein